MIDTGIQMWLVQYLREAPPFGAELPRVYRVASFSGDTVWGVNVATGVLAKVNRTALDTSGRIANMRAFTSLGQAMSAAVELGASIQAEVDRTRAATERAARTKRLEQEEKYPILITEEQEKAARVTVEYAIGRKVE